MARSDQPLCWSAGPHPAASAPDGRRDPIGRNGRAEEMALSALAADLPEERDLTLGLYSFSHHVKVELTGQRDDGQDDLSLGPVDRHVGDEAAVDLERVDGE